ncbi:MAG TPA: sterol desaturase family protein [Pelobium sp.]|nr:sterol desaturase family protein [Pelobium sp.]
MKKERKIQKADSNVDSKVREFKDSFVALLIFTALSMLLLNQETFPYTLMYLDGDKYGVPYFILSIFISIIIHDTYFYWTHRMLHTKFFQKIHRVHHQSHNPTPWAAFAFHPVEALIQNGITIILPFIIPLHPLALLIFLMFSTFYTVYVHSGYELFPKFLLRSKVGKWINSSIGHNMHHELYSQSYGLYFRFWDVVMKTAHPQYRERIDLLTDRVSKVDKRKVS